MNRNGQVLIENLLSLGLIVLPLGLGAGHWAMLEYQRCRCALVAFQEARQMLIANDARVDHRVQCSQGVEERIVLKPLRDLDRGGDGLELSDWIREARSLWEELSSFSSPSPGADSGSP
jgi:hypothetical protein